MKAIFAWTPLGLIVNNWDAITQFFADIPQKISAAFDGLKSKVKAKFTGLFSGIKMPQFSLFGGKKKEEAPEISKPETVLAAAQAALELETRYAGLNEAGQNVLISAQTVVQGIDTSFRSLDMASHGSRLMQDLASGMTAQAAAVILAATRIGQGIENAMPKKLNAAMAGGAPASQNIQKRASGGSFQKGFLLTGEQGAELEYKDRGGFIAHHGQLKEMASLSKAARAGIGASGNFQQAASDQSNHVTNQITINANGGDARAIAQEVERVLARQNQQAARDNRRRFSD